MYMSYFNRIPMATMESALYISRIICNPKAKHNLKDFSKYFARDKKIHCSECY